MKIWYINNRRIHISDCSETLTYFSLPPNKNGWKMLTVHDLLFYIQKGIIKVTFNRDTLHCVTLMKLTIILNYITNNMKTYFISQKCRSNTVCRYFAL